MTTKLKSDDTYMQRAIQVSFQARITAPPNPWVGCVLVRNGSIVGEGFTHPAGGNHAEVNALNQAGDKARGATAYVTLEPCSHYGKTPPCVSALIKAQISRVVIGLKDPDPRVSGKGVEILRQAGIEVTLDVYQEAVSACLAPYLHQRITGLPYCVAKGATSIDGRIAAKDGSSRWITSDEARAHAHQLRAQSQAIIIGSKTAISDKPQLTVRDVFPKPVNPPLRVILDSSGNIDIDSPLFDLSLAPTLIVTTSNCPESMQNKWKKAGAEVSTVSAGHNDKGVNLLETLQVLGKRGILQVLVEGGGTLLGSLLAEKHIQQLYLYVGSCVLGDSGLPLLRMHVHSIHSAPKLILKEVHKLGNSLCAEYFFGDNKHP